MSSMDGASVVSEGPTTRKYRFKTSIYLLGAAYVGLLGLVLLVVAFFSPYWLASHKYTYSSFVRLGLWNFCFDHYRHPPYQYDETFTGCAWIYSQRYHNIRDWLQPGWFIIVQSMVTTAIVFSMMGMAVVAVPIMHYALRYNVILILVAAILQALSGLCSMIAWIVFASKHDTRSWLMNPRHNHLDWAFYTEVLGSLLTMAATVLLVIETRKAQERRQRFTNLVYNMHPRPGFNNGFESMALKQQPQQTTPKMQTPQQQHYQQQQLQHQQQHPPPHTPSGRFDENVSIHSSPYTSISRFSGPSQQQQHQHHTPGDLQRGYRPQQGRPPPPHQQRPQLLHSHQSIV